MICFFVPHIVFGDITLNPVDSNTWVSTPPGSNPQTITIQNYISNVLEAEIGIYDDGDPDTQASLKQGFLAQAIAIHSNLSFFNAILSTDGSFNNPYQAPLTATQKFIPSKATTFTDQIAGDPFSLNIIEVNGSTIAAPFGAKLWSVPNYTLDADIALSRIDEPYARKTLNSQVDYEDAAADGGQQVGLQQAGAMELSNKGFNATQIIEHYYGLKPPAVMSVTMTQGTNIVYAGAFIEDPQQLGNKNRSLSVLCFQ